MIQPALTTAEARRVLSTLDDSIDRTATDLEAYAADYDEQHLHLTGTSEPTWFFIRPLAHSEAIGMARRCMSHDVQAQWEATMEECFRLGVTRIEGLGAVRVRHEVVPGWPRKRLADSTCEAVPHQVRMEIGAVVWRWSTLSDDHRKNSSRPGC